MRSRLLLADSDPTSLRVLDVSLRSAGFEVVTAQNGADAWALLENGMPDLIIADASLAGIDGFELCLRTRRNPLGATVPLILLAAANTLESKMQSLAAGASDYLVKPAYVKEVVARVRALLQRRDRDRLTSSDPTATSGDRFAGDLADITVVDVVQLMEASGRSGMARLRSATGAPAEIYFRQGKVIDAEAGRLSGMDALSRLFTWNSGTFELEWKSIRRKDVIAQPPRELVAEGMRRLDEWNRISGALPDANAVAEVDYGALAERLAEIPDEINAILRLCDGTRTLMQVVEDSALPDVDALTALTRLRAEGIIHDASAPRPARREPSRGRADPRVHASHSGPLAAVSAGTRWSAVESGAILQSFADRLETDSRPLAPPVTAADPAAPTPDETSKRQTTAPGLGQPDADAPSEADADAPSDAGADAAADSPLDADESPASHGSPAHLHEDAIPTARTEQDNVIKFPKPADSVPDSPLLSMPVSPGMPTLSLGRAGDRPATASTAPSIDAGHPPRVQPPAAPTDTQRGVGPGPRMAPASAPDTAARALPGAVAHGELQAAAPGLAGVRDPSGRALPSLYDDSERPPPPTAPPLSVPDEIDGPRSGKKLEQTPEVAHPHTAPGAVGAEGANRVRFSDHDISARDALDELGLPSRWRSLRFVALGVALAAGGAFALQKFTTSPHAPAASSAPPAASENHEPPTQPAAEPASAPAGPAKNDTPPRPVAAPEATVAASSREQTPAPNPAPPSPPAHAASAPAVDLPTPTTSPVAAPAAPPARKEKPLVAAAAASTTASIAPRPSPKPVVMAAAPEHTPATNTLAPHPPASTHPAASPAAAPRTTGLPPVTAAVHAGGPADPTEQLALCRAAFTKTRWRDALPACTAAVASNPQSPDALTMLAHTELNRGRLPQAYQLAVKAVALDPNLADAYVIIGGVHQDSGQNRDAKTAYRKYLQLAPQGRYADELRSILNSL